MQLRLDDIRRANGTTYDSACSGVLVSRTWIMTAGHCFHDGNRNRVGGAPRYATTARLGTVNTTDPAAGVTRTVVWVEQSAANDIALARLSAPVTGITPPALSTRAPAPGQLLTFAGWGATTQRRPAERAAVLGPGQGQQRPVDDRSRHRVPAVPDHQRLPVRLRRALRRHVGGRRGHPGVRGEHRAGLPAPAARRPPRAWTWWPRWVRRRPVPDLPR